MSDYVFKSPLSIEEIEEEFKDFDVFEGIKAGLEDALAYERGKTQAVVHKRDDNALINWKQYLLSIADTIGVGVYALVTAKSIGITKSKLFYFTKYNFEETGVWFLESGCHRLTAHEIPENENTFDYIYGTEGLYGCAEFEEDITEEEKKAIYEKYIHPMLFGNVYYEIDSFQHSPMLPNLVDEFTVVSEREAVEILLSK